MAKGVILKKLSGTASIFPDCKFLVVQLLDMDASSAVKRVLFSGGKNQTVVDDGKNDKIRRMDLTFYHGSVQLRTQKLLRSEWKTVPGSASALPAAETGGSFHGHGEEEAFPVL